VNLPVPTGELAARTLEPEPVLDADFEALYRSNHAFVWRCARRMGIDESELEDVIQDVFVIAYRRRDQLDPQVKPCTWLFGILRNVVRNRARGRGRRQRRVAAYATQVDARERQRRRLETELGERLLADGLLAEFLRELDEGQRSVFVLAELEGYTGKEIAAALGINPNTAHSRLRLARRAFRAHFGLCDRAAASAKLRELREQDQTPPESAQTRTWSLMIPILARPSWAAAPAGALASGLLSALGSKLLAALVGVIVAVGLAAVVHEPRELGPALAGPAASTSRVTSPSEAERPLVVLADGLELEPELELAPVLVQAPARAVTAPPKAPAPDVAEPLRQARAALIDGRPAQALALLDDIPSGEARLLEARAATRVAALCKLGEVAEAQAAVTQLRERVPSSPVLARLESACW
jgi:RNA polymerase sigma factor (sigma-70 family)